MPKPRDKTDPVDAHLRRLAGLSDEPTTPSLCDELRRCLSSASNLVIGKAVEIIGERELTEFAAELAELLRQLMSLPTEAATQRDQGCVAKIAVIDTLARLGHDDPDLFLTGMKYVQFDPGWPSSDSGVNVRGASALALARSWRIGVNEKLIAMTELLNDLERSGRVHAVHAIAEVGHECVIPLLRVKAQCGDGEPEVIGACFSALLRIAKQDAIAFVAGYLSCGGPVAVEAAASLGESGLPPAIQILIQFWSHTDDPSFKDDLLSSLGLSRHPAAIEFLISKLNPVTKFSEPALRALAPLRFYPDVRERIRATVQSANHRRIQAMFDELFQLS